MALFKTTEDIKEFYPVSLTLDVDALMPTLQEVEQEILVDQVLGLAQYNELHAAYQANTMTAAQQRLLKACRPVAARIALHRYVPEANVNFNSGGLTVANSSAAGIAPASEWRTRDVERRLLNSGYKAIDFLFGLLFNNQGDYITWALDPIAAKQLGFLRTARDMQEHVNIGGSEWFFRSMRPIITRIEQTLVKPVFCGSPEFENILQLIVGSAEPWREELFAMCRAICAHLAMADAIIELGVGKDDRGIFTFQALSSAGTSIGVKPAESTLRDTVMEHHQRLGNAALHALKDLLLKQAIADNLHPYRATDCYAKAIAPPAEDTRTSGEDYHAL